MTGPYQEFLHQAEQLEAMRAANCPVETRLLDEIAMLQYGVEFDLLDEEGKKDCRVRAGRETQ